MADSDADIQQPLTVSQVPASNDIKKEQDDAMKKKAALTLQALDQQQLLKERDVLLESNTPTKEKPENNESLRDIYARCLAGHPDVRGHLTNGIRSYNESDGTLAVASSSQKYYFTPCVVYFPNNDTIKCGQGWDRPHLEAMVDAAKQKGWDAIVIGENTSKSARKELEAICKQKGISVVDKSVTAKLDSEDTPRRSL